MNVRAPFFLIMLVAFAHFGWADDRYVGLDTLDAVAPQTEKACRTNVVISPFAIRTDEQVFALAASTNVLAERISGTYRSVCREYAAAADAGRFRFLHARAFCVGDPETVSTGFRARLLSELGTAICRLAPSAGAESWLKTMMDGDMEDFSLTGGGDAAQFVELVSVEGLWLPSAQQRGCVSRTFRCADGRARKMRFRTVSVSAEILDGDRWAIAVVSLDGGQELVLVRPCKGATLTDVRKALPWSLLFDKIVTLKSRVAVGSWQGTADLSLPDMDMRTETRLGDVLRKRGTPLCAPAGMTLAAARQVVRFRLQGRQGVGRDRVADDEEALDGEREGQVSPVRQFVADVPFLFLIRHEATQSVPVVGLFTGVEGKAG